MKLLIAIPALNEEQSISSIISRCLEARDPIVRESPVTDVEITVVSDGSTDRTVEKASTFGGAINLIEFEKNRGYGAAIMEAWSRSKADLLGFLDADGTCDPRFFAPLCRQLDEQHADVAVGCRLNANSEMPLVRRVGNTIFARLLSFFASEAVRDTASGMRVVRRSALRSLFPLPTGMHFTPAMSARAMLSDATRIVELDMPYAEREGRSKLNVVRDGVRFLKSILENAILYRSGRVFLYGALAAVAAAVLLMMQPLLFYVETRTVAEWMIYRFLVSGLAAQVALLLWGCAVLSDRMVSIALQEEKRNARSVLARWIRTRWLTVSVVLLALAGGALVWPSAVDLWNTGHTNLHWSRFVVAMQCFGAAALFCLVRAVDGVLDLVEERVRYLRTQSA